MAAGCKKSEDKSEPPPPVVECKPFCEKTFGACGREVFIASGKLRPDKAKLFNVTPLLEKLKAEGQEKCLKGCEEHQGVFGDSRAVNACMKLEDCQAFAACVTKHIK
jgi:hypothetical protein